MRGRGMPRGGGGGGTAISAAETAEGVGDRDAQWFAGSIARTDGSAARRSSVSSGIHPTIES